MDNEVNNEGLEDTTLQVRNEEGKMITIDVIDIFKVDGKETEYIIYAIGSDIYASILYEDDETFELQTIEDKEDYEMVMARIEELTA